MWELKDPGLPASIHSAENVCSQWCETPTEILVCLTDFLYQDIADYITLSKQLLANAISPEIQWWLESYAHVNRPVLAHDARVMKVLVVLKYNSPHPTLISKQVLIGCFMVKSFAGFKWQSGSTSLSSISSCCWELPSLSEGMGGGAEADEEKLAPLPKWLCLGNGIFDICLADKTHHQI